MGRPIEACFFCGTRNRPRGLRRRTRVDGRVLRIAACFDCKGIPGLDVPDKYRSAIKGRLGELQHTASAGRGAATLLVEDARTALDKVSGVALFLSDVPFNIGFEYQGNVNDNLPEEEYHELLATVARKAFVATVPGGSFVLIHYPEPLYAIVPLFRAAGWTLRKTRPWVYEDRRAATTGKFPASHRVMAWFTKGPQPRVWVQPPKGWDLDWCRVDQVRGGSIGWQGYGCQMPAPILRHWISTLTNPGDLVADPFLGTGSTAKEAVFLGRRAWGCDINPEAAKMWDSIQSVDGQESGPVQDLGPVVRVRQAVLVEDGISPDIPSTNNAGLEGHVARREEGLDLEGPEPQLLPAPGPLVNVAAGQRVRVLDLYAGLGGWGKAFKERGHEVIGLDWNPKFGNELSMDIREFAKDPTMYMDRVAVEKGWVSGEDVAAGRHWLPDLVLASPDCRTFSVLANGHWSVTGSRREPVRVPVSDEAKEAIELVRVTLELIEELEKRASADGRAFHWFMENPVGMLAKVPMMSRYHRVLVHYCKYGMPYQKPTHLWGRHPPTWAPRRPLCRGGDPCHVRGKEGVVALNSAADRALVPYELSLDVCLAIEAYRQGLAYRAPAAVPA